MPAAIGEPTEPTNLSQLENLDDFSLLGILEEVKIVDLINLAAMNNRFSKLIADHVITYKFLSHKREIVIDVDNEFKMWYEYVDGSPILITTKVEEVFAALEYFGHVFNNLQITIKENAFDINVQQLQYLVNKYCSRASLKLHLSLSTVVNMDLSFPAASEIAIIIRWHLALNIVYRDVESMTESEIERLQQTKKFLLTFYPAQIQPVIDFLRLHPQLRSFQSFIPNNSTYLTVLNDYLPDLEKLSVTLFPQFVYDKEPWPMSRFTNVKHFSVKADGYPWNHSTILESIQFDRLESFQVVHCLDKQVDFLIDMIVNNTALQNVNFSTELSSEKLWRLFTPLQELNELTVNVDVTSTGAAIRALLQHIIASGRKLTKLTIRSHTKISKEFCRSIPQGWAYNEALHAKRPHLLQIFRSS